MPNSISRLYNFVDDANNGVPITALRVDSELNQLVSTQNQAAIVAATAPSSPINGELWIDSVNKQLKQYRNTEWVIMGVVHYGTVMATPQAGDVWIDNSGSEAIVKFRNKANSAWIQIPDFTNGIPGANLTGLGSTPTGAGVMPIANQATGTANGNKFVRDDGTLQLISNANLTGALGAWSDISAGVGSAHQAATDGLIIGFASVTNGTDLVVYTDSSNPPTTIRCRETAITANGGQNGVSTVICPVKKGDYYKVTVTGTTFTGLYFIPLGA